MLLVTGITGHTGSYFVRELIKCNYSGNIRCIVRESSNLNKVKSTALNMEFVYGDLNDSNFINESLIGINQILHIYNIHHSPEIVKAAINNGVERVILVHTTGIYSQFKDASKRYKEIEAEVKELVLSAPHNLDLTILRPSMIYGDLCDSNVSKFIKIVDMFPLIPVIEKGDNLIQPVNARDLGKAYYSVLVNPEETANGEYDLTGPEPITIKEMYTLIAEGLGKKRKFVSIPIGLAKAMAILIKIISLKNIDYIEKVSRMTENRSYSHDLAKLHFNFSPMPFSEGIRIEINEYLKGDKL